MGLGATFHALFAQCSVLHGSFPLNRPRAKAELRASLPNGWAFALGSMGFDILIARVSGFVFGATLSELHPNTIFLSTTRKIFSKVSVDMVFTDLDGVPPPSLLYWTTYQVPHMVFWEEIGNTPTPAPGWQLWYSLFQHAAVGGSSMAAWYVGVLSPSSDRRFDAAAPTLDLPWAPFAAAIDESLPATEINSAPVATPVPAPIWSNNSLVPSGLFPHDQLNAPVYVPSRYSKSQV